MYQGYPVLKVFFNDYIQDLCVAIGNDSEIYHISVSEDSVEFYRCQPEFIEDEPTWSFDGDLRNALLELSYEFRNKPGYV